MSLKGISIYDISFYNQIFIPGFTRKKNLPKGDIISNAKNSNFLPFS